MEDQGLEDQVQYSKSSTTSLGNAIGNGIERNEIPLILFPNTKNPILIPPSIVDLLRDKPPDSQLSYTEEDDGLWVEPDLESEEGPNNSEDEDYIEETEEDLSGVKVISHSRYSKRFSFSKASQESSISLKNTNPTSNFDRLGFELYSVNSSNKRNQMGDDLIIDWDGFWLQFKTTGPKLVPFLKTMGLYFVIFIPEDRPSTFGMIIKCLPVLSLALFVLLHGISLGDEHKFARRILFGLLFSVLGDALLIWPACFLHGMAAFAVAQIFYIKAFGFEPLNLKLGAVIFICSSSSLFLIAPGLLADPFPVAVGVIFYSTLLTTMFWRVVARVQFFEELWNWTKLCTCLGGFFFVISDTVLALNRFYMEIPHHQVIIMVTYYLAQLGLALSIVGFKETSIKDNGMIKGSNGSGKLESNSNPARNARNKRSSGEQDFDGSVI